MATEIKRIEKEFVLKKLMELNVTVNYQGPVGPIQCRLAKVGPDSLEIAVDAGKASGFQKATEACFYFDFMNSYHTFKATVEEVLGDRILLRYAGVYKNLKRKYTRMRPPEDMSISFALDGKIIELNFPKSEEYNPAEEPDVLALNDRFDMSSIVNLVNSFRAKLSVLTDKSVITMFRERKPETWEEKVVSAAGRILFLPDTEADIPERDPFPSRRILTKENVITSLKELGMSYTDIEVQIHRRLEEKAGSGIAAELYCPILYKEYAVGYIHVSLQAGSGRRFTEEDIDYIFQFSRVLSFTLKQNGYFKNSPIEKNFDSVVIDISGSGLMFSHPSDELSDKLNVLGDVDITLRTKNRKIVIESRIMRKFSDKETTFYGVHFVSIKPEDFRYLFELLYGREFRRMDEQEWEGGAPAPAVDLDKA